MRPPQDTPRLKNICDAASFHTRGSSSLSHLGMKRNLMPSTAPSSVTLRTSRAIRTAYGKVAVNWKI